MRSYLYVLNKVGESRSEGGRRCCWCAGVAANVDLAEEEGSKREALLDEIRQTGGISGAKKSGLLLPPSERKYNKKGVPLRHDASKKKIVASRGNQMAGLENKLIIRPKKSY